MQEFYRWPMWKKHQWKSIFYNSQRNALVRWKHTVFGKVIDGLNVVDSIQQNDTIQDVKIIRIGTDAKNFNDPRSFQIIFQI